MDDISVAVSGATTRTKPDPHSRTYGSTSTRVDAGGTYVDGSPGASRHGSLVAGMRASHASAAAISAGPDDQESAATRSAR